MTDAIARDGGTLLLLVHLRHRESSKSALSLEVGLEDAFLLVVGLDRFVNWLIVAVDEGQQERELALWRRERE